MDGVGGTEEGKEGERKVWQGGAYRGKAWDVGNEENMEERMEAEKERMRKSAFPFSGLFPILFMTLQGISTLYLTFVDYMGLISHLFKFLSV